MTLNLQMRPITHFPSIITNESLWSISVWIFGVGNHIPLGQILVVITNGGGDVYQIISNHGHLQSQPCFAMVHEGVSESRWFPSQMIFHGTCSGDLSQKAFCGSKFGKYRVLKSHFCRTYQYLNFSNAYCESLKKHVLSGYDSNEL